jgi:hypothetical protein
MKTKTIFRLGIGLLVIAIIAVTSAYVSVLPARGETNQPPIPPNRNRLLASNSPASLERSLLTFQGRLSNANGQPINTPIQATFRIYTDVSPSIAAMSVWTSSLRTITPTNGLFTVQLGELSENYIEESLVGAIGVQVATDASEMQPRQPVNSVFGRGYIGVAGNGYFGVAGNGTNGVYGIGKEIGVVGTGFTGVSGYTYENDPFASGVFGGALGKSATGVRAYNDSTDGAALSIENGAFRVLNAGLNTPTTAFIHTTSATNLDQNCTFIDNPIANNNPNALLFVTHNLNPKGIGGYEYNNHTIGLWYSFAQQKWCIYNQDRAAMTLNLAFNVLIVVP